MKSKIYKLVSSAKRGFFALALTVFSGTIYSQTTYTFNYTGSTQTISLPAGNYSIECWGADGGNANNGTTSTSGGKGGYSSGIYTNTSTATFNVYVGGHGGNASGASNVGGGGGGMSDVVPASNTTLIIIAAGGGGGSTSGIVSESSAGGDGGGLVGATAPDNTGVSTGTAATGGSQTAGGFAVAGSYGAGFPGGYGYGGGSANGTSNPASPSGTMHAAGGSGGNGGTGGWNGGGGGCTSTGGNDHSAGGGAGYYGGGGGRGDGGAGGGGSSYIGGVTSGTTIMFGQSGFVPNPDLTGNGKVIIKELCSISLTASGSNSTAPSICAGQSVTLTTNAISNYSWSTGNTTSSVIVVSPATTSVYALSAMSPSNCMSSKSITVTVSSGLPVLTITNTPSTLCLGKTATLTASGALSYTWSGGAVPVTNGQSFLPTATATYTVAGQNGCGIGTATTAITIAPLVVTASASSNLICAGNTTTLTAVSSVTGYTWMPNNNTMNPAIVSPAVNTIYTVAASDGTCFGTATVAVNTNPNPTITIAASNSVVCEGAIVTMTASGGSTYTWSPGNSNSTSISDNPLSPTLYQVVGASPNGCLSQATQIVLTNTAPLITVSANKTIVCVGDPAILTASGASSYSWTNGPSTAVNQVNPTVPSVYTVTGVGSNSCTAEKTISVNVLVANVSVSTATNSICNGGTTTLTASGANTYVWVGNSSFNGVSVVSPTVTTNYSVIANTTITGLSCPSSTNITITVFNNPTISILATKTVVCKSDPAITLTGTGAVTYAWSTGTTSPGISVKPQTTTTYTVMGTDANGCQNTASIQIKVNVCNGISELTNGERAISVFPNPSNGVFTVSSETELDLSIVNEIGQVVKTIKLTAQNNRTVQVDDLSSGFYFIVGQKDSLKINHKVVIVK